MIDNHTIQTLREIVAKMGRDRACEDPKVFAGAILDMCELNDVKQLTNVLRANYGTRLMEYFRSASGDVATWTQQKTFLIDESGMSVENAESVLDALWKAMDWQCPVSVQSKPAAENEESPKEKPKLQPPKPVAEPEKIIPPKEESGPRPEQEPQKDSASTNGSSKPETTNWFGIVLVVVCIVLGIHLYNRYTKEPELSPVYHSWVDDEGRCWDELYRFERSGKYRPMDLIHIVTVISDGLSVSSIDEKYEVPYGMNVSESARKRLEEIYQSYHDKYYLSGVLFDGRDDDRPEVGVAFPDLDTFSGRAKAANAGYLNDTELVFRYRYIEKLESDGYRLLSQ